MPVQQDRAPAGPVHESNMIVAGSVGAAVPLLMQHMRFDPAVASAVLITTLTDVFGFLLFLGIASAFFSLIL